MRTSATLLVLAAVGCGASTTASTETLVTGPFTESHEAVFENGLDLVAEPDLLEGPWLETWEDDLDVRVTLADLVALTTVQTVRTDIDLDRDETYRLVVEVDRSYLGVERDELTLTVREGEAGYDSVVTNATRLLQRQFLVFVKWVERDGAVVPRWHLSPATDQVAGRVERLLRTRRQVEREGRGRRRVIVRRQE
jgi:hypothetical protein